MIRFHLISASFWITLFYCFISLTYLTEATHFGNTTSDNVTFTAEFTMGADGNVTSTTDGNSGIQTEHGNVTDMTTLTSEMTTAGNVSVSDMPDSVTGQPIRRVLHILVSLPHQRNGYFFPFGREMAGPAVISALKKIEEDGLLPDYKIQPHFADSGCNAVKGLGTTYDMLQVYNFTAVIGPQCSQVCRAVARLAAHLNIPCFSGVCQDVEMGNKNEFKTLTRFLGTFEMTGQAVCDVLARYGWSRVGIIAEKYTDFVWFFTTNGLKFALPECNVTIAKSTLMMSSEEVEDTLIETAATSRIIVIATHGDTFRELMRVALREGYDNGDYIFICINYYQQERVFGNYHWQQGADDDEDMRGLYQSVFFLEYYNRHDDVEYKQFTTDVKQAAAELDYIYQPDEQVPYPAANLYEATYLLAVALRRTLVASGDITDGYALSRTVWGEVYDSVTGSLELNVNGDRVQSYTLKHVSDTEEQPRVQGDGEMGTSAGQIHFPVLVRWAGQRHAPPPDTPPCGFLNEHCVEDPNAKLRRVITIFCSTLSAVIIIAVIFVTAIYKRLTWLKEMAEMQWKIDVKELQFVQQRTRSSFMSMTNVNQSVPSMTTTGSDAALRPGIAHTALHKGVLVEVKKTAAIVNLSAKSLLRDLKLMWDISHSNVAKFIGISVDQPTMYILQEFCVKGSLQDLLENNDIMLDWSFKLYIINDIVKGLRYLHNSALGCHGNLMSSNCLVDSRFVVKHSDFGVLPRLLSAAASPNALLWSPPELLRDTMTSADLAMISSNKRAMYDVYSLGIILQEIIYREGPFYREDGMYEAEDIISKVVIRESPPFRPSLGEGVAKKELTDLVRMCWDEDCDRRPRITQINKIMDQIKAKNGQKGGILDNLLNRLEQYASNLEALVEQKTRSYLEEKQRVEHLLHRLLPPSVAKELQSKGAVAPVTYKCVTVYFSDVVGFTTLCSQIDVLQVVTMLNELYTLFDEICENYDVYKVETIGDAYMVVSGLPKENGIRHAHQIACMALALLRAVDRFRLTNKPDYKLKLRIGIHSGSCAAGVVGVTMPRYCLFGDTVNTASRMESHGEALKIHISETTCELLEKIGGFDLENRGSIEIKGKGLLTTSWLLGGPPNS